LVFSPQLYDKYSKNNNTLQKDDNGDSFLVSPKLLENA